MDLLNYLRTKDFFDPTIPTGSPSPNPIGQVEFGEPFNPSIIPEPDNTGLMGNIFPKPKTEMRDRFSQFLGEMPVREKPSTGRKIVASMIAAGPKGYGGAKELLDAPFLEQMEDWKAKGNLLHSAATEESRINRDTANNTYREVQAIIAKQKADTDALKNQQIYETKQAELTQRITTAENNLKLAYDRLQQNANDAAARMELQKARDEAVNARHELTLAQRDRALEVQRERLEETVRRNEALNTRLLDQTRLAEIEAERRRKVDEDRNKTTTTVTKTNPEGTERVVTTSRGGGPGPGPNTTKPTGTVRMIGRDGKSYDVPADKVDDAIKNYGMKKTS